MKGSWVVRTGHLSHAWKMDQPLPLHDSSRVMKANYEVYRSVLATWSGFNCTYILFYTYTWKWARVSKNNTGVGAKASPNQQNLQHPFKNSCEFQDLKVKFKSAGPELLLQNLWKERTNNKNCSWFYAPGMKCYNTSIIHMWVHVIYLQLELLSIQQLKPKNCWYIADEKTFAGLSAPAFSS